MFVLSTFFILSKFILKFRVFFCLFFGGGGVGRRVRICHRAIRHVRFQVISLSSFGYKACTFAWWPLQNQRMWLVGHFLNSADEPIIPQNLVVWITMKSGKFTSNPEGENKSLKYIFNKLLVYYNQYFNGFLLNCSMPKDQILCHKEVLSSLKIYLNF